MSAFISDEEIRLIPRIGEGAFALYCFLKSRANENGVAEFIGYAEMQQNTGAAHASVNKYLTNLQAAGLIVPHKNYDGGRKQESSYFMPKFKNSVSSNIEQPTTTSLINSNIVKEEEGSSNSELTQNLNLGSNRKFFSPSLAQDIWREVTKQVTFPGDSQDQCTDTLRALWFRHNGETISYLLPFWEEWKGRGYARSNVSWLTEWAVGGEIPQRKNGKGHKAPAPEYVPPPAPDDWSQEEYDAWLKEANKVREEALHGKS